MIDLYSWPTPNGYKVAILLEELGLPYRTIPVNIGKGEQFTPDFLEISPNNKIPAIVDPDGPGGEPVALFESGAILLYLADKTGRLIPPDPRGRWSVVQWLMFQMGTVGPMLGQTHHFRGYAPEPIPYAVSRYTNEATRIYNVIDRRLGRSAWLAGEDYTIVDIATWPWLRTWERQGQRLEDHPHLARWYRTIEARAAVQRGVAVLAEHRREGPVDEEARRVLFGEEQYRRR